MNTEEDIFLNIMFYKASVILLYSSTISNNCKIEFQSCYFKINKLKI